MDSLHRALQTVYTQLISASAQYGQGSIDAEDDAIALVCDSLALPHDAIDGDDFALTPEQQDRLSERLAQRITAHVPTAYLTQKAWLQGYSFYVDQRVIIPRSFIAELIVTQFEPWLEPHKIHRALDLCCGSGCLAILLSEFFPHASIDASDISSRALEVAQINRAHYAKESQIQLYESNLFSALHTQKYDLIICNPPYVNSQAVVDLPSEFCHEPKIAFDGGIDGMDLIRSILRDAPQHMNDSALLFMEIGNEYEHFIRAFPTLDVMWVATETRDDALFLVTKDALSQNLDHTLIQEVTPLNAQHHPK